MLAAFLVTGPNLKQVVSKTWQTGLRGNFSPFGLVRSAFFYGAFYDTGIYNVSGTASAPNLTNPDTITPAQPFSVYDGVKVKF